MSGSGNGNYYRHLWDSGDLARHAAQSSSLEELAQRIGRTGDALTCGLQRLRQQGVAIPSISALLKKRGQPPLPTESLLDEEPWEEPTNPTIRQRGKAPPMETLQPLEEHKLKRKIRDLEEHKRDLLEQLASLSDRLAVVEEAKQHTIDPLKPREGKRGLAEGCVVALASDWHVEEEVIPGKVQGRNKYNLDISRRRAGRFFSGVRWFINQQRQNFAIRDLILWLGGDMITGHLHPDNVESTLLAPPQAFAYAKQLLSDGIKYLLTDKKLERIMIPCNDGNHGRLTKDLRAATRVEHSIEWLMYAMLAEEFKDEPRVQFEIAQGDHLYTQIYDHTIRWTHGAEVRYWGGVGGITVPLYRALARWQTVRHADVTVFGHFHQYISMPDLVGNGSLIGYSPYALRIGARYEAPQQAAFVIDPHRGKSISAPIWVSDENEE